MWRWVAIQNEYRKGRCVRDVDECIRRDGASVVGDASVQGKARGFGGEPKKGKENSVERTENVQDQDPSNRTLSECTSWAARTSSAMPAQRSRIAKLDTKIKGENAGGCPGSRVQSLFELSAFWEGRIV